MAVSIEAAFVLLDKASGPLKEIRKQAALTNKELHGMGTGTGGFSSATSSVGSFQKALEDTRKTSKALGTEIKDTGKKVDEAGNFFKRHIASIQNWGKALLQTSPVLKGFGTALGGVLGAVKGVAGALPLMAWAALAAAPAIVSLAGAVGALGASLGAAVGGGVLLGGGLLGSFAVGLGSIVAVAKPAMTATKNYMTAVKNLNTAIASGSPTAIKARQQQLDAIAKANPGVAALAGNLKKFETEWKKASAPGRASFFQLATDGIQVMRKLLPTLATETNKNTAALQQSFQKILAPFLDSSTFKGFVSGLGGIFRANLPGFMNGLVNVFTGLANILKVLTPQLDKAGSAFQGFTQKFANWTASGRGRGDIKDMTRAFTGWMDLLKGILRLVGVIGAGGMKSGTGVIEGWAKAVNKLADNLSTKRGGIASFFQRSLDQSGHLADLLKPIASDLAGIYKVFKPLGSVTSFIIKNLPAPAVTALMGVYLGIKGVTGAVTGAKGVLGFFDKLGKGVTGGRGGGLKGALGAISATRGDTELNPLYVWAVNSLGGGGGPGGFTKKFKKGGAAADVTAAEQAAKDAAPAAEDTSALAKALPFLKTGGKVLGGVGVAVSAYAAISAYASAKGSVFDKFKAAAIAGDPTSVLNAVGLPSFSQMVLGGWTKPPASKTVSYIPVGRPTSGPLPRTQGGLPVGPGSGVLPRTAGGLPVGPASIGPGPTGSPGVMPIIGGQTLPAMNAARNAALVKNTHDTVVAINNQWLLGSKGVTGLWKDTTGDVLRESDFLHDQMHSKNKAIRDQATKDWTLLSNNVTAQADGMANGVVSSMAMIASTVQSGSAQAASAATTNFGNLAATVQSALKSGAMNSGEAAKLISQSLNAMLKAFGQAPIPNLGSVSAMLKWENWWQGGAAGGGSPGGHTPAAGHRAKGGRLPGEPRGDHLPLFGRGGSLLGIADGGELVVNRHTEAKADSFLARFGTRLSNLVAGETKPHNAGFAKGGRLFATGGTVPYSGLEGLWDQAGGPRNLAPLMAAIAMAESGGSPSARNPSGATGLWQILGNPFPGNALDALTNARMAVAKYRSQGLGAWVTYTSGAYRPYMHGNVPPGAYAGGGGGGGGAQMPLFPHLRVPGTGTMQRITQASVNKMVGAANRYINRHQPAPAVGGGGGGGGVPGAQGPKGLGTFDGHQVADWIIPILNWARGHGWTGSVTSGYRPGFDPSAPGGSEHALTQWPGGAIDVGGPAAVAAGTNLYDVLKRYPGHPSLLWGGQYITGYSGPGGHDYGHFSGTGHALGGRLPWFAHGADFIANRPQVIGVGDSPGGERVTVTPQGQGGLGNQPLHVEIHKIEVNRKGDVQKIVDEELRLLAATIESHL